jgi:subtilase family serine protease
MAVTNVYTSPDSPNVDQLTTIYVTVKNKGDQQKKDVPVKAYVDGYQVGSAQYVTLTDGKTTKSFTWTPSTAKTYSVKGEVGVVSGETETSDNEKTINVIVSTQPVCIPNLTIPVYTPYLQRAHKGTELRYTINVTNEGTITDIIDLDVA